MHDLHGIRPGVPAAADLIVSWCNHVCISSWHEWRARLPCGAHTAVEGDAPSPGTPSSGELPLIMRWASMVILEIFGSLLVCWMFLWVFWSFWKRVRQHHHQQQQQSLSTRGSPVFSRKGYCTRWLSPPPPCGGNLFGIALLPCPRYPTLSHEDTTHSWMPDYRRS